MVSWGLASASPQALLKLKKDNLGQDVVLNVESIFKNVVILSPTAKRLWRQEPLNFTDNQGQDVVLNALRLNNNFTKMQIRASKLARKHFYSLLHPVDSNACLGQDVVILRLCRRQTPSGPPKLY